MNSEVIKKVGIVGAGNLAWHLSIGIQNAGYEIEGVYNRSVDKAEMLATKLSTRVVTNFKRFKNCDLVLLIVSDDAIRELAGEINQLRAIVAHTSGNTSLEILFPHQKIGVFDPVKSSRKDLEVDLRKVSFLV